MTSKAKEFDESLESAQSNAFAYNLIDCDYVSPSNLSISTITFLFITSIASIDIESITSLQTSRMRNCVVYKFRISEKRKCAIKIFRNGRLHVTGCNSAQEAERYIKDVLGTIDPAATIVDFEVQMINSNFAFQCAIDLYELARILEERQEPFSYNKDHHHALRFKADNVSIMVFMSGSVIITGGKTPESLFEAYKKLVCIVEKEFFNGIVLQNYVHRKRKRTD